MNLHNTAHANSSDVYLVDPQVSTCTDRDHSDAELIDLIDKWHKVEQRFREATREIDALEDKFDAAKGAPPERLVCSIDFRDEPTRDYLNRRIANPPRIFVDEPCPWDDTAIIQRAGPVDEEALSVLKSRLAALDAWYANFDALRVELDLDGCEARWEAIADEYYSLTDRISIMRAMTHEGMVAKIGMVLRINREWLADDEEDRCLTERFAASVLNDVLHQSHGSA